MVARPGFDIDFAQAVAELVDGDDRLGRVAERRNQGLALRQVEPPHVSRWHQEVLPKCGSDRRRSPYWNRPRSFLKRTSLAVSSYPSAAWAR